MKKIDVCIPARNEERTIGLTLDSFLCSDFDGEVNVLVCANDCRDGTEDVIKGYMEKYPNVRLITTKERGKPNAWNLLRRNANSRIIYFSDADVVVEREAIRHLYDNLVGNKSLVGVGAMVVPYFDDSDFLTRLVTTHTSVYQGCLPGALYAVYKAKLSDRLKFHGLEEMPKDVICDDGWITGVIGPGGWIINPRAKVHYRPCSWRESSRVNIRFNQGIDQLKLEYPKIWDDLWKGSYMGDGNESVFMKRVHKLISIEGFGGKIHFLAGFLLRRAVGYYARMKFHEGSEKAKEKWQGSYDSKEPIILH